MLKSINLILLLLSLITCSCADIHPPGPESDQLLDGPVDDLTFEQQRIFIRGDKAFNDLIFTSQSGLGPLFVATSCGSCHAGDGKGHPFSTLTRFGQSDASGNLYLERGGPQLQHLALPGYVPESIPLGAPFTRFTPPANTGLGFLDFVSDETILEFADPTDADGDGISGVPNWISLPSYVTLRPGAVTRDGKAIGRYGKKAATYDLLHQTVNAFNQDIGITSTYDPKDTYTGLDIDPEVTDKMIADIVFYLKTLKAPVPRNQSSATVIQGKQIFTSVGCAACHRTEMTTDEAPIASLNRVTFAPYTDLLLHDMGAGLNDGYTEGSAETSEWRTPALWGLGLSPRSQGGQYFLLHDGRARSIDEAIRLHGGEALQSRDRYVSASSDERRALLNFLESL